MPSACQNCNTECLPDARFCHRCGNRLFTDAVDADLESRLYERIEAKLKDKWLAKDFVEKDIALKAASNLSEWLKLAGIPLGIAGALLIATLSYFGIKSTADLAAVSSTAEHVKAEYKPLQDNLPHLQKIADQVSNLETRVNSVETEVARFARSSNLPPETEETLKRVLSQYRKYLTDLGLQPPIVPNVHVEDNIAKRGCYHGCEIDGNIYILASRVTPSLVAHEYTHSVLLLTPVVNGDPDQQWQYSAIEAGVANYLTADFLNSPVIDEVNLERRFPFTGITHTWAGGQGEGGLAWGSFLWKLRMEAGPTKVRVTKAVAQSWMSLKLTSAQHDYEADFLKALGIAGLDVAQVKNTFAARQ